MNWIEDRSEIKCPYCDNDGCPRCDFLDELDVNEMDIADEIEDIEWFEEE